MLTQPVEIGIIPVDYAHIYLSYNFFSADRPDRGRLGSQPGPRLALARKDLQPHRSGIG